MLVEWPVMKAVAVIDSVNTYHYFKNKEALHILWERSDLNKQVQHYDISLSFEPLHYGSFIILYLN